jgi:hypothetical protein
VQDPGAATKSHCEERLHFVPSDSACRSEPSGADQSFNQNQENKMKKNTMVIAFAVISALTITASLVSGQSVQDKQSSEWSKTNVRTIRGAWRTVVTPRNCQTDAPITSLAGLFTFNEGGTMSEYGIGPGSSPALRSPGHGVWRREHGWQDYSFAFTFYRYDASGVLLGSQKVTAALELFAGGDEFASRSMIEVLDVNGSVVGTGCATAVGRRFE